jgi:hypothetical protein
MSATDDGLLHATDDCVTSLCGAPLLDSSAEEEERLATLKRHCPRCWNLTPRRQWWGKR